jgi:hypothetical protein
MFFKETQHNNTITITKAPVVILNWVTITTKAPVVILECVTITITKAPVVILDWVTITITKAPVVILDWVTITITKAPVVILDWVVQTLIKSYLKSKVNWGYRDMVFNASFNNISVISWQLIYLGGGKRSILRKTPTCRKSLTN